MLLIMGEISRNDVGIPPEVNTDFDNEKQNRKMMGYPSGTQTDFNNEKQKKCWGKSLDFLRSQ